MDRMLQFFHVPFVSRDVHDGGERRSLLNREGYTVTTGYMKKKTPV